MKTPLDFLKRCSLIIAIAVVPVLGTAQAPVACNGLNEYSGTLDETDDTFGRVFTGLYPPYGGGSCSSSASNSYEFDVYSIYVEQGTDVTFEMTSGGDNYLNIYQAGNGAANPFPGANTVSPDSCNNAVAADDDSGPGLLAFVEIPNMNAGWVDVVVTSFSSSPSGAYGLVIQCGPAAPEVPVPTMTTWSLILMAALILLLGGLVSRRRPN